MRFVDLVRKYTLLFSYSIRALTGIMCRRLGVSILYINRVGVKFINKPLILDRSTINPGPNEVVLSPDDLFLDFDLLNDAYTLLDTKITDSPHYRFMEALRGGEDLRQTEYIHRVE
jgi:hypothetical protein